MDDRYKELEAEYLPSFLATGVPDDMAMDLFQSLYQAAKSASAEQDPLPPRYGDILLRREQIDPNVQLILANRRAEGVRDADIRWWWNLPDLDRHLIQKVDEMFRIAAFTKFTEEDGMTSEDAGKMISKHYPIFGDPSATSTTSGDDRPLPVELKDRISAYMMRRSQEDLAQLQAGINAASSVNAFVRSEIRRERL
ncbi:MAG: hypothetical protein KKD92_03005 [Proteobacteria bacterium]|nr:hypothetical protein [Pseudomonadota bacterium]